MYHRFDVKHKIIRKNKNKNTENLCDLGLGKKFLDRTPKVQTMKGKTLIN